MMITTAMSESFDPPCTAESSASLSGRGALGAGFLGAKRRWMSFMAQANAKLAPRASR